MSNLLSDFEVEAKNPSLEARQRWRSSVSIVKNRARRFRNIPDLDKLAESETKRHQIQVRICVFYPEFLFLFLFWGFCFRDSVVHKQRRRWKYCDYGSAI